MNFFTGSPSFLFAMPGSVFPRWYASINMFYDVAQFLQADDVSGLSKMIALVQSSPPTSPTGCDEEKLLDALAGLKLDDDSKSGKPDRYALQKDKEKYEPTEVAHVTKLCASFTRATTLLTDLYRHDGARCCIVSGLLI
jgi:hypothetical protein